jgi:3',5'-cyclic AMP phosphodiesterase CpdA
MFEGVQVTQREEGEPFSFALLTDSHIGAHLDYSNQGDPNILRAVSEEIDAAAPDFVVNLGDMLDFHEYGFQLAPPDGSITRLAYLNYRDFLGATVGHAAHFGVIGNWEGENGNYTPDEIAWSRDARLLYLPGPTPDTYRQGGSPAEDYYAFTWGDALFIALNVMTYTPTEHLLSSGGGTADDWTLGEEQLAWLESTLENATSKWRFLLIHHAVGGAAGDVANSNYGRGGGQAAHVGEQALVHQLMIDHGVQIFFYGHDHVFTDMVVDDIHYSMPGSAGAIWFFDQFDTGYEQSWPWSGWGHVDVTSDSVHVQFVKTGGELVYEYTLE